jgi:hypothetical protein
MGVKIELEKDECNTIANALNCYLKYNAEILKKDKTDEKDDFFIQLIVLDISGKTGYLFDMDEFKTELKNKLGLAKPESEPQSE